MTNKRLYIILIILLAVLAVSGYFVIKDEVQNRRIKELATNAYAKLVELSEQKAAEQTNINIIESESKSTSEVNVTTSGTGESHQQPPIIYVPAPPVYVEYDYEPPDFPDYTESEEYKEWKKEFDKRWDEAEKSIEETRKEMEESQQQWCEDYPESQFCD